MSQARKSNVNSIRRGVPKAHVPYRADDLTQGKKTGISVKYVDRKSDGFESFGEILDQADGVTPPHVRAKKKRGRHSPSPVAESDDQDENGEMSMEIDNSMMDSPQIYLNRTRRPSAPTSVNRSANHSYRSSVNYDDLPSPRASTSSNRPQNGITTPSNRQRSRLSEPAPPQDFDNSFADDDHGGLGGDGYVPPNPDDASPRNTSFADMDEDGEEDTVPVLNSHPPSSPILSSRMVGNGKGKGKARQEEQPSDDEAQAEDDIVRGLQEIEESDPPVRDDPPSKGKRSRADETTKKAKAPAKKRKVQFDATMIESRPNPDGVRRSQRVPYRPLEYWRNEKVVYGRRESGISMVPVIKDIIRIPKEDAEPLTGKKSKRRKPSSKKESSIPADPQVIVYNPEEGWDDETDPHGVVVDFNLQEEVQRRVAFTAKMVNPKQAAGGGFMFQKIFGDGEFIAAGQLVIPVGEKKPNKGTKDNTYVFYLIEGAINLKIHRSSFVLATGGMFLIPRGNNYYIENISQRPARLFFAQARKVTTAEGDENTVTSLRKAEDLPRNGKGGTPGKDRGRSSSTASPDKDARKSSIPAIAKKRAISK